MALTPRVPGAINERPLQGDEIVEVTSGAPRAQAKSRQVAAAPPLVTDDASTDYTLALVDTYTLRRFTSGSAVGVTVPANATVAFPIGQSLMFEQAGAGTITVAGAAGVTVNGLNGLVSPGQYAKISVTKVGTDLWIASSPPASAAGVYLPLSGGIMTGDLLFTDGLYDIGKAGATRPRDLFISRNFTMGGTLSAEGSQATFGFLILKSSGNENARFGSGNGQVVSGTPLGFTSSATSADGALRDLALSRIGPGIGALGTGAVGNAAGTLQLATLTASATIATGAPAGSTAGLWKLGALQTAAVVLDTTRSIFVDIGGTVYKLMVAQ